MNLTIEYLLRNGTIRQFFQTPCSVFLENSLFSKRLVICLKKNPNKEREIIVRQWHLLETEQNKVKKETFQVDELCVFSDPHVIVDGLKPIPYIEQPISSKANSYNHPIDLFEYNRGLKLFLNSSLHKSYKKDWLWDSFVQVYFNGLIMKNKMILPLLERRYLIEQEKKYIKTNYCDYWRKWNIWVSRLISNEPVAPELIFLPSFAENVLV